MKNKTELEALNEFLIRAGSADRVGIRRKIVVIERFLEALKTTKIHSDCDRILLEKNHFYYDGGVDFSWNCFIDNMIMGAICKRSEDKAYGIVISHEGDDPQVNESKWIDIFKNILNKEYKTPKEAIEDMANVLREELLKEK